MGKVIDITEKLSFEEKPVIRIGKAEIEVNNEAEVMLKVMGAFQTKNEAQAAVEATNLLFDEKNKKKLDKLKLNFKDFMKVIEAAIDLIQNDDNEEEAGGEE